MINIEKINRYSLFLITSFLLIAFSFSSCNTTKYLKEGESLVKGYEIKINVKEKAVKKSDLVPDLKRFVQQKPNTKKLVVIPAEYGYFQSAKDPKKLAKYDGELPTIYNQSLTDKSVQVISQYLNNQKGYYQSTVKATVKIKQKKAFVTYNIELGHRYYVDSVNYFTTDNKLRPILNEIKENCLVKPGDAMDESIFLLEKNRIVNELQNRGYSEFAPNHISIVGDSIESSYFVDVFFEILPPLPDTSHRVYTVGTIKVFTDHYNKQDTTIMKKETIDGITYYAESSDFLVRPRVLNKYISFRPNELISRQSRTKTYRKISNLEPYRFSAIVPKLNPFDSSKIDYEIQLTPYTHRWTADYGMDFFNSTITKSAPSVVGRTLIGLGLIAQMTNRNLLGGGEKLNINAEVSTQLQLKGDPLLRSLNLSLSNNLTIPVFKDPFKFVSLFNTIGIIKDQTYKSIQTDGTSNINLSVSDIDIKELYKIFNINASFGYRFTDDVNRTLSINQMGFNINDYTIHPAFDTLIEKNPFIKQSFEDNLMTGLLFRDLVFYYSGNKNAKGVSYGLIANLEQSGAEVLLVNKLTNVIFGRTDTFALNLAGQEFKFSKFIKLDVDGRINKTFGPKTSFAARINFGIIQPYSNTESAPYLKKLFVGGPNSLRAWIARTLGPGKTVPDEAPSIVPYSQGDIKFEVNAEYRFDLWRPYPSVSLEGAVFTDVGNVWNLGADQNNFTTNFYKDLAIAAGYGLRFDFSFFIIRFDFAYKIRKPYTTVEENFYWYNFKKIKDQGIGTIQVGINYPF